MKSCTCASLDSPVEASRPSFYDPDGPKGFLAPKKLIRKPSKLQISMEVAKCRFGSTSRQVAPIGYEGFVPQKSWMPIYYAVYHDRKGALHHFLHNGVSPDDTEGSGIPLLFIAAAYGHFEVAKILLEAGAHVDAVSDDNGETAFHIAVRGGRHDIIDLLLEHRADLEAKAVNTGATPLHYAANGPGSLALVVKLLKSGAHYDVEDLQGQTPAAIALQVNNLHAAVAIINMARGKPEQLAKEKNLLLQHVEKITDRSSMTNDLIADAFAATCDTDSTVLIEAIKRNDAKLVEMFLEKGADPHRSTEKGLVPIFVAVKFADLRIIKMLVQHGADIQVRDSMNLDLLQVLFDASSPRAENSVVSIVDYLLTKGADGLSLYSDGKTLLHRTVNSIADRDKIVKLLLKNGIDVNIQDNEGNTALHLAARNGLANAAQAMLDAHADTTITDLAKQTPLLHAVLNQKWSLVRMLAHSPVMTFWDAEGSTALHHIARTAPRDGSSWGDIAEAIKPFCEQGICRSMRDRSGATPLIMAIRSLPDDGLPVVQALLVEGDKKWNCVGHEDHEQRDALYYAATLGRSTFVEALLEQDAPLDLKDWSDSKRQFKLPVASKHQILELLIRSDRLRTALKSQMQHGGIGETRIEINKAEPRSISALSGYGADCEAEQRLKPNRSAQRKVSSTQYLQVPAQQRKSIAPTASFSTYIARKQQRPLIAPGDPHQISNRSPAMASRAILPKAGAVWIFQHNNQPMEATKVLTLRRGLPGVNASFPPRASSKQHIITPSTTVPPKPSGNTRSTKHMLSQKESGAPSISFVKDLAMTAKVKVPSDNPQVPLKSQRGPTISTPQVPHVATASNPDFDIVLSPSAKPSTTPMIYPAQVIAEPVPPMSSLKPSSAARTAPVSGEPIQPARVDSGVIIRQNTTIKALPTLDRSRATLDGSTPKSERQSGDELATWLAISGMLDRL